MTEVNENEKVLWNCSAHNALLQEATEKKMVDIMALQNKPERLNQMLIHEESLGVTFDFTRQLMDNTTLELLENLAKSRNLQSKIEAMFKCKKINSTENRAVLHVALRSHPTDVYKLDNVNVVNDVHNVLNSIKDFSEKIRKEQWKGYSEKPLKNVICIGIGGSYLGPEFVYEALKTDPTCKKAAEGRQMRFLANVDPIDIERALSDLDLESTLCIVVSKTFTTAETMLNARTVKNLFLKKFNDPKAIAKHMVAVSTNKEEVIKFGIEPKCMFGFWDWVGGRFSVCSAVGCLPLAVHYGFDAVREFLDGCREVDQHFKTKPMLQNIPVLAGFVSFWNSVYLGVNSVAVLPYCQALLRFPAYIQQLTMESNGKRVTKNGISFPEPIPTGEIFFGEPGTNGQHSFYQLLHQGHTVQAEFIGFIKSQTKLRVENEVLTNHDELMCNFFAQPDALAMGKTPAELKKEGCPDALIPHKTFTGNRPSSILLLPVCTPSNIGKLIAIYEHRTAVEGFLWDINSFDQWGVELGKQLAKDVRNWLTKKAQKETVSDSKFLPATNKLLEFYYNHKD